MALARDAAEAQLELARAQRVVVAFIERTARLDDSSSGNIRDETAWMALYYLGARLGETQPKCAVDRLPPTPTEEPAPLGSFGALAAFSFHDSKNISSGEGGALIVNDPALLEWAEILWEMGTNRSQFLRNETDKYNWLDMGSSFLPSEVTAAILMAQLEKADETTSARRNIWALYQRELAASTPP
jgi:DegT/DnrJ/EryC1/StrS aminotransferase family